METVKAIVTLQTKYAPESKFLIKLEGHPQDALLTFLEEIQDCNIAKIEVIK
jgi:hypothetical protein